MKKVSLFGLAIALVLPLFAAVRPVAAAQQVTAIAQATGEKDPYVQTWLDDGKGNTTIDQQSSTKMHDLFSGLQYVITDQSQLLLGQASGSNLNVLIAPHCQDVTSGKGFYYLVHLRTNDGIFFDGKIYRDQKDPTQGYAEFTVTALGQNGASASTHVEQNLTFAGSNPKPSPGTGGNPFTP